VGHTRRTAALIHSSGVAYPTSCPFWDDRGPQAPLVELAFKTSVHVREVNLLSEIAIRVKRNKMVGWANAEVT
jgi:hypothetical protein